MAQNVAKLTELLWKLGRVTPLGISKDGKKCLVYKLQPVEETIGL
jgi:hypothetical protein